MCRHATTSLPPEPRSSSAARTFVRDCLADWELLALLDDAQLAVTELVTNAVLHARTPLLVSISSDNNHLELAVFDCNPVLPRPRPARQDLVSDLDELLATDAELGIAADDRDPRLDIGPAGSIAGGRGLLLVAAVAAEWGVSPLSDGKAVWVRTPTPAGWPPAM
ncbi:MAG: ATP-binding protein, partial [Mycobacteriales bacterium]